MYSLGKLKLSLFALVVAGSFTACSDDDSEPVLTNNQSKLGIYAQASYLPNGEDAQRSSVVELSRFLVNIKEIELEYDNIIDDDNFYGSDDDIELKGPFELDLLSSEPIQIVDVILPNGVLEEIEFEFDKNENPSSELYKQSMRMEGSISGTPFVFWHDFEEEIELEFEDALDNGMIIEGDNGILINFDLYQVLNGTAGVDLSTAVDGNGDGIIEISPNDQDGNRNLAEAMKQAIKSQIDILEDLYD